MVLFRSKNSAFQGNQRGTTTVEFAVIAALVFIILFGIIEYAILFLQEHYVANAAREGVRVGVRANNYSSAGDREQVVKDIVANYLNTFYDETEVRNGTTLQTKDLDNDMTTETDRVLIVTVAVDNLFTNLTPRLLRLLDSDSNVQGPPIILFSARMELEDPNDFDFTN